MHPFNPNGLFDLGSNAMMPAQREEAVPMYPNATLPSVFGDATMPCWRRRAAWINTAGSFYMTWCADARPVARRSALKSAKAWCPRPDRVIRMISEICAKVGQQNLPGVS